MTVINKFVLVIVGDYPSSRMFNHFDKVLVSLDKFFLRTCKQPFLYTCKHTLFVGMLSLFCIFIYLKTRFVCGYAAHLFRHVPCKGGWDAGVGGMAPSLVARKTITPNYFFRTCKRIFSSENLTNMTTTLSEWPNPCIGMIFEKQKHLNLIKQDTQMYSIWTMLRGQCYKTFFSVIYEFS